MFTPSWRFITKFWVSIGMLLLATASQAGGRKRYGEPLSVDLNISYQQAVKIVREIAEDGIIRGTWQYRGTTELEGAVSATTARGFPPWKGEGTVLYKVRPDTLSPEHFYESADKGTVEVRYILQASGPNLTRLQIDATFSEDSGHRAHPSDGQVENSEFAAISAKIQEQEDSERKRNEEAAQQEQQKKFEKLQTELEQEQVQLDTLKEKEQQLQQQLLQKPPRGKTARVRTPSADLKAAPYNQAKTLQLLNQGEMLTVLLRTPSWYRVQAANGEQGWVYHLMLETD